MKKHNVAIALALALPALAQAAVYAGNPSLRLAAVHTWEDLDGGIAVVDKIVLHDCDGTPWVDDTDTSFDPSVGGTWDIPAGDWCSVAVWWDQDLLLEGSNASGDFEISHTESKTVVSVDPGPSSTPLTPYTVTVGSIPSGHPRLRAEIE